MKVLLVGPGLYGDGVSVVLFNLYCFLVKAGIGCDVAITKMPDKNSAEYEQIINDKNHVILIPRISKVGPLKFYKIIKEVCINNKYDVIHIHTGFLIWLSAWAARSAQVPVRIGHAHGSRFGNKYSFVILKLFMPLFRFLNRKFCTELIGCSKISCIANFGVEGKFFPNYVFSDKLTCYTHKDIHEFRKSIVPDSKALIFGYMGTLSKLKNVLFLPQIIYHLRKLGINAYLLIAGRGPKEAQLLEEIKELKLGKYVLLLGQRKDTNLLIQTFDYYISASLSEGMSMSMIEAQLSGKQCFVSSLIPAESNLNIGLFYQIKGFSAEKWAQEIISVIKNSNRYSREEAIRKAEEQGFSVDAITKQLLHFYNKI